MYRATNTRVCCQIISRSERVINSRSLTSLTRTGSRLRMEWDKSAMYRATTLHLYRYCLLWIILNFIHSNLFPFFFFCDALLGVEHYSSAVSTAAAHRVHCHPNRRQLPSNHDLKKKKVFDRTTHTAYIALVRSVLEYGATVCDPYLKQDINKLERIQRQAACFITKDYRSREPGCIENTLKKLQLPPRSRSPQTAEADHTAQDGWGAWCQRCHQNIS